jgi:hypothetical protein
MNPVGAGRRVIGGGREAGLDKAGGHCPVYLGGRGGESSRPDRLDRGGPRMLQMAPHLNFPPVHCTKRSEAHAPVSPLYLSR